MNVLSEIIGKKRERVAAAKERVPLLEVRRVRIRMRSCCFASGGNQHHRRVQTSFTFEGGDSSGREPVADRTGVTRRVGRLGFRVLTEEDYFDGSLDDLRTVKTTVDLPVLRKILCSTNTRFTNPLRQVRMRSS